MSQISRPFQIVLLAACVLAAAWLIAFRGHSSSPSGPSSSAVVSSPTPTSSSAASAEAEAKAAAAPTSVYKGSAPGVQGLSRAISEAHGAVATSQRNAHELEQKSAQASSRTVSTSSTTPAVTTTSTAASATPSPASAAKPIHATSSASTAPAGAKTSGGKSAPAPASKPHPPVPTNAASNLAGVPAGQRSVEAELAQGDVVVVLFWNPDATDDVAVRQELRFLVKIHHSVAPYASKPIVKRLLKAFGLELDKKIAINEASANQAASFGSITRTLQVYGTPTMLVIDKSGKTIVLNGLQDAFSIEQAIDEARNA
jgi:hypothetical protein